MTTTAAINHIWHLQNEDIRLSFENRNLKILLYRAYTDNFTKPLNDSEEAAALKMNYSIRDGKLVSL